MMEYLLQNMCQVWLIIAVLCLILELFSGDFFILCFAVGAVGALIVTVCGLSWAGQIIIFAIASVLSLLFVRPIALKYFHRNDPNRASNADALMGREGKVSQAIAAGGYGRVAIDGDDWKSKSADGSSIEQGTTVRVVNRESIILTVEEV